jgi:hypothetical protein
MQGSRRIGGGVNFLSRDSARNEPHRNRGDSTPIELFLEGVGVSEPVIRPLLCDKVVSEDAWVGLADWSGTALAAADL